MNRLMRIAAIIVALLLPLSVSAQTSVSARLATNAALPANTYANGAGGIGATLTANANGALTVDGSSTLVGDTVLVKNEVSQLKNGLYIVDDPGSGSKPYLLTRATSMDESTELVGAYVYVIAGSVNFASGWYQITSSPITVGTSVIVWANPGLAGYGLVQANNGSLSVLAADGTITVSSAGVQATLATPSTYVLSDASTFAGGSAQSMLRSDSRGLAQTGLPAGLTPTSVQSQGVSTSLARADHVHAMTGFSSGTTFAIPANPIQTDAAAASAGVATTALRSDSQQIGATAAPSGPSVGSDVGSPAQGTATTFLRSNAQFTAATATGVSIGAANGQGTSAMLSRADHTHAVTDLNISGQSSGDVLNFNGSNWVRTDLTGGLHLSGWSQTTYPLSKLAGQPAMFGFSTIPFGADVTTSGISASRISAVGATGTASSPALSGTTYQLAVSRRKYSASTAANSNAGICWGSSCATGDNVLSRGSVAGVGGFYCLAIISQSGTVLTTGHTGFVGVRVGNGTFGLGSADPKTEANKIGFGFSATDAIPGNWKFFSTDNAATLNQVDTGCARSNTAVYEFMVGCLPNGGVCGYRMYDRTNNALCVNNDSYNTNLPSATVFMQLEAAVGVVATGVAQTIDLYGFNMCYTYQEEPL